MKVKATIARQVELKMSTIKIGMTFSYSVTNNLQLMRKHNIINNINNCHLELLFM